MTSRRFCLPDAGSKGETICFWNLGVCLKPLLNLLCKAVVEHLKGKRRAGTPWSLHTGYMNRFMLGEGCLLVNKCLCTWQNLVLHWVINMTWLWGLGESSWPSFASKVLLWLPLSGKKEPKSCAGPIWPFLFTNKDSMGHGTHRSAKVQSLLEKKVQDKDVSFGHIWFRSWILSNSPISW